MIATRNLVLVHSPGWQGLEDFIQLKAMIEAQAPDIEVMIADNASRSLIVRKRAARRPALVFSPIRLIGFQPLRGKIYQGVPMSKLTEMQRLAAAGVPVPHFEEIRPETRLDEAIYGPYVIVKPSDPLASFGQAIELRRTSGVVYRPPSDYPEDHPGRQAPMVAQKFIDCGKAMTCRVLTFFGAPIFTFCRESTRELTLEPGREVFEQAEYMPAPPHAIGYISRDADFFALAAAAYEAMPEIALQACDILRAKTGEIYLLEVNPGGGTWMFSNKNADGYRKSLKLDDLTAPFDAFNTCARLLIERTRAEAI